MTSLAFESVRRRGFERLLQTFEGNISKPSFGSEKEVLTELLSYPYARILISCVNEPAFTRRYALLEATAAYSILKKIMEKEPDFVLDIEKISAFPRLKRKSKFEFFFGLYLDIPCPWKDLSWKLINRRMEHGYVTIQREEFAAFASRSDSKKN